MLWLVDNETGLLWALHHKQQRLFIFVAKRRSTQLYRTKNMFWFVWRQTGLFPASEWPWFLFDCLQKNVLAFSFIGGKTCLGLSTVKWGCSQRYCTGKRFSASFQRVMLIFISFCSKEPFRLFWAKLRCFQHYVSEKRLFLGFLRKLCFWPFILSKTCFGVLAMKSDVSSNLLQTNSDVVFRFWMPFFSSHSGENTFLYVGNALLWVLYHKKKRVAPLPRSRRGNRYILTVQCSLTNRAEVFAMSNQRATTSAKVLVRNWICRSGVCLTAFIAIKAVISSQEHSQKCAKSAQNLKEHVES